MAIYNPLNWQNENALSNYPFRAQQEIQDLIVDAKFVQFDNFVPTLRQIIVNRDDITLTVDFDYGQNTNIVLLKAKYLIGAAYRQVRIFNPQNDRCVGVLVFGPGALTLWESYVGRKLTYMEPFLAETTRSIPSKDAVYKLDGNYGNITLGRTEDDSAVFYNTSLELNAITFNAVGGNSVPKNAVKEGLRKINLVPPLHNNINLASNDTIKIRSSNASYLTIELVSGSSAKSFLIPTLIA